MSEFIESTNALKKRMRLRQEVIERAEEWMDSRDDFEGLSQEALWNAMGKLREHRKERGRLAWWLLRLV